MKIQFSFVGMQDSLEDVWVELDEIPQEGQYVYFPKTGEISVRTVVWFPTHNDEDEEVAEPFVYVVLGPNGTESVPSRLERYLIGDNKVIGPLKHYS